MREADPSAVVRVARKQMIVALKFHVAPTGNRRVAVSLVALARACQMHQYVARVYRARACREVGVARKQIIVTPTHVATKTRIANVTHATMTELAQKPYAKKAKKLIVQEIVLQSLYAVIQIQIAEPLEHEN